MYKNKSWETPKKRGGTRKIADIKEVFPCRHPEHDPPNMMVFEPGIYEHTCPACGHVTRFVVSPLFM